MSGRDTMQKILNESLTLFSRHGYAGVSIRNICGAVGIKESTLYYYFENKRAVLTALQARFEKTAAGLMAQLQNALAEGNSFATAIPATISEGFFNHYLMDGFCNSFLRLLSIEQYGDAEMQALYQKWLLDEPLRFQDKVFTQLMGLEADSEYLALKYYSPIFLYFQRYLLSGAMTEEKKLLFQQKAETHTVKFFMECGGR